uniref:Hypothetical chloroplast protein RF1 n=1 Tax=Volvulina compacta TaxID=51721 RepID=A0A6C0RV58_9CHLO|nr:hypothetical chloroplast protein RF1 [Volvulina compacta]
MISFTLLSLVTSVKDYVEITHKLIEIEPLKNYTEFGAIFTYFIFSIGDFLKDFFTFSWLKTIWSIPIIIPDIASAMISEVSVLDSYFHFDLTLVNTSANPSLVFFEKFMIGFINSLFLILPTSTSHLITLRRFVMQGLEAGYIAGLGTLAGNFLWLSSIILGWRFLVIPWLSLDIFRYLLGFSLLVKYLWDSSKERRMALEDLSKWKIFLLNFLLSLTEQSCIYPFISNISLGPDASILEGFPAENYLEFLTIHCGYLFGILIGSFSLLQFTCWFWENPAFSIYLWLTTKYSAQKNGWPSPFGDFLKMSTASYYKILNFTFLYATMLCAIASIPYYGLDYTLTNPIGLIPQDRILEQKKSQSNPDKLITETAFLNITPTDKNSRIRDGATSRRERWKHRLMKYQAFDPQNMDKGIYDFLTIEDLNYGFDRFWLRRKMRNHQIRFRVFPGPWMRSLKKQLNNPSNSTNKSESDPRVESSKGISFQRNQNAAGRAEFFRILFEQFYHPNFHNASYISALSAPKQGPIKKIDSIQEYTINETQQTTKQLRNNNLDTKNIISKYVSPEPISSVSPEKRIGSAEFGRADIAQSYGSAASRPLLVNMSAIKQPGLINSNSALRKYVRNVNTILNIKQLKNASQNLTNKYRSDLIYSKRWKSLFSKIQMQSNKDLNRKSYQLYRTVAKQLLLTPNSSKNKLLRTEAKSLKLKNSVEKLSLKERRFLHLRSKYLENTNSFDKTLRNLNISLQKEQAFKRKLRYYTTTPIRKLTVGNQGPYFKTLMKRGFYYYKPSLRWKKTLYVAKLIRGFRKKSRKQRVLIMPSSYKNQTDTGVQPAAILKSNILSRAAFPSNRPPDQFSSGGFSKIQNQNNQITSQAAIELSPETQETISLKETIKKPTHSYTVLGKQASRYRHQIYKDVLQHWYYTPFNRLLLKFDVDAFINRQPKSHFLTKNEERLLHIRRFLLSEHYDTLRWYTYMQHYNTMKTTIGGTKSFANRAYNQQFQGTFKKIRHLFAITPKQGDYYILKFDQPLYNENKLSSNVYFHEELNFDARKQASLQKTWMYEPSEFLDKQLVTDTQTGEAAQNVQSSSLTKTTFDALQIQSSSTKTSSNISVNNKDQSPTRIAKLSLQNNDLIDQTNFLILETQKEKQSLSATQLTKNQTVSGSLLNLNIYEDLFVKLIKECKKRVHDQAFLKNYITHRIEKREQLNSVELKQLNKRLEKLKNWYKAANQLNTDGALLQLLSQTQSNNNTLTTSINKVSLNSEIASSQKAASQLSHGAAEEGIQKAINQSINIQNKTQPGYAQDFFENILELSKKTKLDQNQLKLINFLTLKKEKLNFYKNSLRKTKKILLQNFVKPITMPILQILKTQTKKNLSWWRKKQQVITKRKNIRKRDRFKKQIALVESKERPFDKSDDESDDEAVDSQPGINTVAHKAAVVEDVTNPRLYEGLKALYGPYDISDSLITSRQNSPKQMGRSYTTTDSTLLRKKQTFREDKTLSQMLKITEGDWPANAGRKNGSFLPSSPGEDISTFKFISLIKEGMRKKASAKKRRYRILLGSRYLTATKKPRSVGVEGLTKVDNITNINGAFLSNQEKLWLLDRAAKDKNIKKQKQVENVSNLKNLMDSLKKAQIKKRGRQTWKKQVRAQFNLTHNKYRKRQIHGNGKLRVMNKKIKKIKAINELRQWWWNSFLPRYLTQTNNLSNTNNIRARLSEGNLRKGLAPEWAPNTEKPIQIKPLEFNSDATGFASCDEPKIALTNKLSLRNTKCLDQTLIQHSENTSKMLDTTNLSPTLNTITKSLPFYAGWDEGLRKFVVTNRLLSRRDTGLVSNNKETVFTNAPIQGLNEGSYLYSQTSIPFNTYNIDQFITTNQSFYAPLGWRRFEFRHLTYWLRPAKKWALKAKYNTGNKNVNNTSALQLGRSASLIISTKNLRLLQNQKNIKTKQALARRIKKRYKLLKQTPNILTYNPTGPLLTQVLPSHYMSVFDQLYRFPRNRYLKRTTLKTIKKTTLLSMIDKVKHSQQNTQEFTLRKRVKPRRKYHKKRFIKKEGLIFPRRTKFTTENQNLFASGYRSRPKSQIKQKRVKTKSNQRVTTNPLRLRQLRRREFQQILKPIQSYMPEHGGFTWPGDYLRLDIIEMPKLKSNYSQELRDSDKTLLDLSQQRKINVQPVGIMPRQYLIEKHNIKVLKKKLEKAYSLQQLNKAIKEYKSLID